MHARRGSPGSHGDPWWPMVLGNQWMSLMLVDDYIWLYGMFRPIFGRTDVSVSSYLMCAAGSHWCDDLLVTSWVLGLLVPMAFSSHPRCCSFQIHEKRTPRPAELVEIRGQNVGLVGRTAYEQPMWRSGGSIWIAHDSPYDPPCLGISWGNRHEPTESYGKSDLHYFQILSDMFRYFETLRYF